MQTVTASIDTAAGPLRLWRVITEPLLMRRWNNDAAVETSWTPGTPIITSGTIGAKRFSDRGVVELFEPPARLRYRYFSRIHGLPDRPENHHVLAMTLAPLTEGGTRLTVTHIVPPSPERHGRDWVIGPESGRRHVEFWWRVTLPILRAVAEEAGG